MELMLAVEADSPEVIDLLLRHGAKPNEGNAFGTSALYQAVCAKRLCCAERLLLGGALVNAHSLRQRHAPLHAACADGDISMVELLLSFGADADVLDYRHRSPLHAAAAGGFAECLPLLLQSGARVDVRDLRGLTPLGVARDAACRRALLEANAALSAADLRHLLRENPVAVQQLLDSGVQPGDGGVLLVSYKPLRDIGGAGRPFEAELLTELQRSGRWQLLAHPAVELLLELTRQDRYFTYHTMAKIMWCVLFLASLLSTLAVDLYRAGGSEWKLDYAMKGVLLILNCIQLVFMLVKLCVVGKGFFLSGRRWPVIVKTALIFVVVFLRGDTEKRLVYAFAVLMAFFEFTMALESISVWKTTRAISSLLHVTRSIAEYLLVYSPVLVGFSASFFIIFGSSDLSGKNSIFHGSFLVINMAAMVLGEVDVMEAEMHAPHSSFGYAITTIIFTMFVILVPIVMLNLLLALTISDTNKFLSKGGAEFLRNLANRTAWNQQAAFMVDDWVQKLQHLMPKSLFEYLAQYSLQLKWQSVLPRPAASIRATPHITVDPFAQDGKKVRAFVSRSSRRFRVRNELRESLDRVVEARRPPEPVTLPLPQPDPDDAEPSGCGTICSGSRENLRQSVPTILRSAPKSGSDSWRRSQRRHKSCRTSCGLTLPQDQERGVGSGATLTERLSVIVERLEQQERRIMERQEQHEQRLTEQLQSIKNAVAKLNRS